MSHVSRHVLSGQSYGLALLGFEHVLSALGLNTAFQLVLSIVLVLIGCVLVGLRARRIGIRLIHPAGLLLLGWLRHAGRRVLAPLASARRHLRNGRSHEKCTCQTD